MEPSDEQKTISLNALEERLVKLEQDLKKSFGIALIAAFIFSLIF
jgi:hypothetical protein